MKWEELLNAKQQQQTTDAPTAEEVGAAYGQGTAYADAALRDEAAKVASTSEGGRNDELNRAAFRMGRHVAAGNIPLDAVVTALRAAGLQCGLPPWEVDKILRAEDSTSALHAGMQHPRIPTPRDEIPEVTTLAKEVETSFWDSRKLLEHLHTYARARRVSPWAVLGAALTRVIAATPYTIGLPAIVGGRGSLNLFVALVGPSGSGKGAAEAVAAEALRVGYIETHTIGSGEGIAHGYLRRVKGDVEWVSDSHAALFTVPEIDTLQALGDRKGATLLPELRRGWSGERLGFGYADPTKRLPVPAHEYRMAMIVGVQPGRAGVLLDDADGGTPQRLLWLPSTDPDAPSTPPTAPDPITWDLPPDLWNGLRNIYGGNDLTVCDTARDVIVEGGLQRLRNEVEALDGHALYTRLKTAAALGIADGRYEVNDEDWELAGVVLEKSDETRSHLQAALARRQKATNLARADLEADRELHKVEKLDDAAVQRVCRHLMRKLTSTPEEGLTRKALRSSLANRDREHLDPALVKLLEAGQIAEDTSGRGSRFTIK